jgi:hypothetical protein
LVRTTLPALAFVALAAGSAAWIAGALRPENERPVTPVSPPSDRPQQARACAVGPWAEHCPEAGWTRAVIRKAGFRVASDTGSAIVGRSAGVGFYLWSFVPSPDQRPLARAIAGEGYEKVERPEGALPAYFDGVRYVWATQGAYVWLEATGRQELGAQVLERIMTASERVPLHGRFVPEPRAAASAQDYVLLYESDDTRVYAPGPGQSWGACPEAASPLGAGDLEDAESAVLAAIPVLHEQATGWLDPEGATADAARADASSPPDFATVIAGECGRSLVDATAAVTVRLPNVQSASMASTTYLVSRDERGWVMWGAW